MVAGTDNAPEHGDSHENTAPEDTLDHITAPSQPNGRSVSSSHPAARNGRKQPGWRIASASADRIRAPLTILVGQSNNQSHPPDADPDSAQTPSREPTSSASHRRSSDKTITDGNSSVRRTRSIFQTDESSPSRADTPSKRPKLNLASLPLNPSISDETHSAVFSATETLSAFPLNFGAHDRANSSLIHSAGPELAFLRECTSSSLNMGQNLSSTPNRLGTSASNNVDSDLSSNNVDTYSNPADQILVSDIGSTEPIDSTLQTDDSDPSIRVPTSDIVVLSLDEPATLPSPRLSPISVQDESLESPTLPLEEADSELLSPQARTNPLDWTVGTLTPGIIHRAGQSLEQSTTYASMMSWFTRLPPSSQAYVFSKMLHKTPLNVLRHAANTANTALKVDILASLPVELARKVVSNLNVYSLCQSAQVSKKWRSIVDTDEHAWSKAFTQDGFVLSKGELERAIVEGWGWQDPSETDDFEENIAQDDYITQLQQFVNVPLQDARRSRNKLLRMESATNREKALIPPKELANMLKRIKDKSPHAHAHVASVLYNSPSIGIKSIQHLHLYKTLYRRYHSIRQSWFNPDIQPYHIAFDMQQQHVITCLQFDSEKIITGSDNASINVYGTTTGERISSLSGHSGGVWALQYVGNTLVSGSTDRSVRVWDIEKSTCLHTFHGHTSTVRCLLILEPTKMGVDSSGNDIMEPSQPLIITGSRDSTIRIWRLPQPGEESVFQTSGSRSERENPYFLRVLAGHDHSVRAIAAHGDVLVSGSYDFSVRVWEISTGVCKHHLVGHLNKVYTVVLDPVRKRCVSGSMDNMVKIWSYETGEMLYTLRGHTNLVGLLDLNHDLLVSAGADYTLRVWNPESGKCLSTLSSHSGTITCFQHDGMKAISGGDKTLKLWDIQTGTCVRDLLSNLSAVWQVKFDQHRCVAAVQRRSRTYIEVLDFGSIRDGLSKAQRGVRLLVDQDGNQVAPETEEPET